MVCNVRSLVNQVSRKLLLFTNLRNFIPEEMMKTTKFDLFHLHCCNFQMKCMIFLFVLNNFVFVLYFFPICIVQVSICSFPILFVVFCTLLLIWYDYLIFLSLCQSFDLQQRTLCNKCESDSPMPGQGLCTISVIQSATPGIEGKHTSNGSQSFHAHFNSQLYSLHPNIFVFASILCSAVCCIDRIRYLRNHNALCFLPNSKNKIAES